MSDEVDDEQEASAFAALGKPRKMLAPSDNIFINKHSGLGHVVKADSHVFRCGKSMSAAYTSAASNQRDVIMCLACMPRANV